MKLSIEKTELTEIEINQAYYFNYSGLYEYYYVMLNEEFCFIITQHDTYDGFHYSFYKQNHLGDMLCVKIPYPIRNAIQDLMKHETYQDESMRMFNEILEEAKSSIYFLL